MKKNEDFVEEEQPQEEFTDPLPDQEEVQPDEDIFGGPSTTDSYETGDVDGREQDIQYERTIVELREQDKLDALALRQNMKRLRKRKRIADMGGNPDYANLETYITNVEQQCRVSQRRALQPEMQAEVERISFENGIRGLLNRARKLVGMKIKIPNNIDQDAVYTTVVNQLEGNRRTRLAELQTREDTHAEELSGEEGYTDKMQEYQGLVRDALAAVEIAEARTNTLEGTLVTLCSERSRLAQRVAKKPHDAAVQKEYHDVLAHIKQHEEELRDISVDLENTYEDMTDNDAKFDHYASLVNQERALQTMSRKSVRNAQRDVDDLAMQRESGDSMGRIGGTVRAIAHSEAERSKVDTVLKPQSKASGRLLSKIADYMGAGSQKRRSFAGGTVVDDINLEQNLDRRDMYTKMRVKYG